MTVSSNLQVFAQMKCALWCHSALSVSVRLLINIPHLWVWCWKDLWWAERSRTVSLCIWRRRYQLPAGGERRGGAEVQTADDNSFTAGDISLRSTCRKSSLATEHFHCFPSKAENLQHVSDLTPKERTRNIRLLRWMWTPKLWTWKR